MIKERLKKRATEEAKLVHHLEQKTTIIKIRDMNKPNSIKQIERFEKNIAEIEKKIAEIKKNIAEMEERKVEEHADAERLKKEAAEEARLDTSPKYPPLEQTRDAKQKQKSTEKGKLK